MKKTVLCLIVLSLSLYGAENNIKYTPASFTKNFTKLAQTREEIIKKRADLLEKEKNAQKIVQKQQPLLDSMMSNMEYSQALLDLALQKAKLTDKKATIKTTGKNDAVTTDLTQRYRSLRNQYNKEDSQKLLTLQNELFDAMAAHAKELLTLANKYLQKLK